VPIADARLRVPSPSELDRHLSFAEVAAMTGMSRWQVRRRLLRLHERSGGKLLVHFGGETNRKWLVTLSALRRLAPELFPR